MRKKITFLLLIAAVILSSGFMWVPRSMATAGYFYFSPSSYSVYVGNTVTVYLRINPGTTIDTVQADVSYNPSLLQYDSSSVSSPFTPFKNTGGGGTVQLIGTILGGSTSSDTSVATITFTALAGSGSSSLGLSNYSAVYSGTATNPSAVNGTVNLSTPPAAPAPTASSGGSSSHKSSSSHSTPSSSTTSSAPATTTTTTPTSTPAAAPLPKVSVNISSNKIQFSSASFSVDTTTPVQTFIKYGTNKNNLSLTTPLSDNNTSSKISLDPATLTPGTTYYYQVAAEINGTQVGQSVVKSFTTKGYTLNVAVLDENYKPLKNKIVTLHSAVQEATTNSSGVATFTDVAPGMHHVEYTVGPATYSQTVYVSDSKTVVNGTQTAKPQNGAVVLTNYLLPANDSYLGFTTVTLVLLALLLAMILPLRYTVLHSRLIAGIERIFLGYMYHKAVKTKVKAKA